MSAEPEKWGPGLQYRPEEWEILAHRWPRLPEHEREHLKGQMNRGQWRRFERTIAKLHEDQQTFEHKLTTREDVVLMIALFLERQVMPMAVRLDQAEAWIAYQRLPWWKRARVALLAWWVKVQAWLEKRGVYVVEVDEPAGAGTEDADNPNPRADPTPAAAPAPASRLIVTP